MIEAGDNPLLQPWTAPFGLPPFERIEPAHVVPAFEAAMSAHRAEIAAIAAGRFGPVLKVSEDGLITFYDGGRIWDL